MSGMSEQDDWPKVMHRFRSRIFELAVVANRLIAVTERGVYRLDKNGKRWRKVQPASRPITPSRSDEPK